MQCMKCGQNVNDQQVFCDRCLAGMESSPVKPGTPVNLPPIYTRLKRRPAERQQKPEEIIAGLENRIRRLRRRIAVLVVLLAVAVGALVWCMTSDEAPTIGQNYHTATDNTDTTGQ